MADNNRKLLIGQVLASKMQKTAVVRIDTRSPHPVYKKYVNQSKKYYVHDEKKQAQLGDTVLFVETRPMSKLKRWKYTQREFLKILRYSCTSMKGFHFTIGIFPINWQVIIFNVV